MDTDEYIASQSAKWERERRRGRLEPIGDQEWRRERWAFHPQANMPSKVFAIERIRLVRDMAPRGEGAVPGDAEIRISYATQNGDGRWRRSQFHPMIPLADLGPIERLANDMV